MYNGIEIDMLNLGDADSILVSKWENDAVTRILIDGGRKKDAPTIQAFLDSFEITHIHHLVCTHIHDDHARGLVELVNNAQFTIDQAWLHIPSNHVNRTEMLRVLNEAGNAGVKFARIITASLETRDNLQVALESRGIQITEPFAGDKIGFMTVCGPSKEFYQAKLLEFSNYDQLLEKNSKLNNHSLMASIFGNLAEGNVKSSSLLDNPETDPENEVSIILATKHNNDEYLLTADAGVEGLKNALNEYQLKELRFMQIPHHGSWNNLTNELINHFAPSTAFVSAKGGDGHPRIAVINAFKNARKDAKIFSTHYPTPQNIWHHAGTVPERPNYTSLKHLYD